MAKRKKNQMKFVWLVLLGLAGFVAVNALLMRGNDLKLLNPKGLVADEQTWLLVVSTTIMLVFAGIVLFFIYFFAWKYRETNHKNILNPRAGRSKLLFAVAWAAPISIFIVLASMMLPATQRLEPQKSIESDKDEMTVRVIAMRWKWLFLYPEQDIASVNFVQIPVDTPVRFELTADEAPMNGFWIPNLGGMLYAMTEHVNPLNLIAHTTGDYQGEATEINGRGFAGMRFTTRVSSQDDFDNWVSETQAAGELGTAEYEELLKPSENNPVATYSSPDNQALFDKILQKYAGGSHNHYNESESEGH